MKDKLLINMAITAGSVKPEAVKPFKANHSRIAVPATVLLLILASWNSFFRISTAHAGAYEELASHAESPGLPSPQASNTGSDWQFVPPPPPDAELPLNGDVKEIIENLKKEQAPDIPAALSSPSEVRQTVPPVLRSSLNKNLGGAGFTFVHLTDVHIGEADDGGYHVDYGTPGYDDAPPAGDIGGPARRLRRIVNWINANRDAENIRFVIVTGDLTASAEKSQFLKAKEILDALTVPYVPMIGNHDIWPFTFDSEAPAPFGDRYFKDVFAPTFDKLKTFFPEWDDGTRLVPAWNSEQKVESWFQNYAFSYGGYHFTCLDFNSRQHAINNGALPSAVYHIPGFGEKGVVPEARLYSRIPEGAFPWLKSHYDGYPGKGNHNMLMFAHHPLTKDGYNFIMSFSYKEYHKLTHYLNAKGNKHHTGLWAAGHLHRNWEYNVKTLNLKDTICPGIETGATKDGHMRLITVWGASLSN
ncbi:MAG: metallophosphoesterase [Elusimicrobia bacterium]|nr:metallophosphoesterase [Elusimicrobiota bacterium]